LLRATALRLARGCRGALPDKSQASKVIIVRALPKYRVEISDLLTALPRLGNVPFSTGMRVLKLTTPRLLFSALAVTALAALGWLLKPMPPQAAIQPAA
jgi:hypothetical protein